MKAFSKSVQKMKISKEMEMELVARKIMQEKMEMKLKGERYLTEEEAMKKYWERRGNK